MSRFEMVIFEDFKLRLANVKPKGVGIKPGVTATSRSADNQMRRLATAPSVKPPRLKPAALGAKLFKPIRKPSFGRRAPVIPSQTRI